VINPRFIKPLDLGTLSFFSRNVDVIATIEDHVVTGGFGSIVAEALDTLNLAVPVVKIGWPDQFIEHGAIPLLREKHGVTAKNTAARILKALSNVKKSAGREEIAVA
jgi:1-deoxy-D-xylulose-5-phosphate synthase